MPPKKKKTAAKGKASAQPGPGADSVMTDAPVTETAGPPKDDAQPAEEDLKADAADREEAGATIEDAQPASDGVPDSKTGPKDPVSEKVEKNSSKPTKKRKNAAEPKKPAKVPREGSRSSARGRASNSGPSRQQLLSYLLSADAEELVRPPEEKQYIKDHPDNHTYPSTELNPFQELMCAMILSRPISHMLGYRAIRTILNDPYNFTTPTHVRDAGDEKRLQAFYDAKTQHKDKTAGQIGQLAETVLTKYTSSDDKDGTQLKKVLNDNEDVSLALRALKDEIKGFGTTGMDIFLRRVQWQDTWKGAYPFVDGTSQDALRELGLPQHHDELVKLLNEHWSKFDTKNLAGKDEAQKKRRAFVLLLSRATSAKLENKQGDVQEAAAKSSS
ncbi:hypothetical protein DOTSEDRAFT_68338 [Dothistroma septosporum NZE10]|uniref:HhH-GPD domain-containing protein n=1 Tax=Dothistroma septosporum (strain NZE10 / CBS 128990) TaxID=675120 RepID=N1Q469_DOTSN|nr:hypothetical protein DOTSEDRAFT_68338 [Dothistroma septosporum NZE10]